MKPYAELLEFNQPNPLRTPGHTKIRDAYPGLSLPMLQFAEAEDGQTYHRPAEPYMNPERIVEFAGRSDYGPKNADKLGTDGAIIPRWIDSGHHSMLEFAEATFYIECSRVVSHELVRHRLASFQQESQRYVKYDDETVESSFYIPDSVEGVDGVWEFDEGDGITEPHVTDEGMPAEDAMIGVYDYALETYKELRKAGMKAQDARYVLPNAMKTRMVMKANLREWRHIINLRTSKAAQPEMQELMAQVYEQLLDIFPNMLYNVKETKDTR